VSRTIETHSAQNPRLLMFYGALVLLLLVLTGGLAYRQLWHGGLYTERERVQNERRIVVPGPRGNILDREGRLLVENRPRFSVVLNLAELRAELRAEYGKISRNYRSFAKGERPTPDQISRIARVSLAQRYLDQINVILHRAEQVNAKQLERHFNQTLLLPYILLDDLAPEEYARLIERLPVNSPLQVYTSSSRYYPYGSAAAHVLGYTGVDDDPEVEDFPGEELLTFKMKGAFGRDGLEKKFDEQLQGESGGAIYRVDPAGYKFGLPLEKRLPVQGHNVVTSLDIDLQVAAEKAMGDHIGAAVAMDVRTGEVLVMASKPDYDLNAFVPRLSHETAQQIQESGGWLNRAIQGAYPTGSTFKIITSVAGLRSGAIDHNSHYVCPGYIMIGNRRFPCAHGAVHGDVNLVKAIALSCNVFFCNYGRDIGGELLATEARRFDYDKPTGIELPGESTRMLVGSPEWKKEKLNENWFPGDSANMAIGQGYLDTTPLQVACMMASFARGETETKPTLLHDPNRPVQHTAPIGLAPYDYNFIVEGMETCARIGTGKLLKIEGMRVAAKTGTAQKRVRIDDKVGNLELGWMVAFAPIDNPRIAIAVVMESQDLDVSFGGGVYASPVVKAVFEKWRDKQAEAPAQLRVTSNP
jgi:penicillin-binding protein 2